MSHFAVMVVGDDVDGQLAPFQENNMGDCPGKFLEFQEDADGSQEHDGKKGYWYNPNAKWDWYTIGGCWTGYFKMKQGVAAKLGRPGVPALVAGKTAVEEGRGDQARIKDIDFVGMRKDAEENAAIHYDAVLKALGVDKVEMSILWQDMHRLKKYGKLSIDEKRKVYHDQPIMKACAAAREKPFNSKDEKEKELAWTFAMGNMEDYLLTRKQYIKRAGDNSATPFAILKDGKWYEKGEMGWWGMVSNEKDKHSWNEEFHKLMRDLDPNTLLTVVDCHI